MPVPTPNENETQTQFVSRCVRFLMDEDPQRDQTQAVAICYGQWRREAIHPDFQRILKLFIKRYGKQGTEKFAQFIQKNGLNTAKPYNPQSQFKESFEWVEPLIQYYKADDEAKYYYVRAITANVSMNNVDYGPEPRINQAAISLSWRPVNLDHNHNEWLPYPRTRVDFAKGNEMSVEATLRVDNKEKWLQTMLDNEEILHPSIEGRPTPDGGYHFTGMALLRKGKEIPGDPLTEIHPILFNEKIGKSMCEMVDGNLVCDCMESKRESEVKHEMSEQEPIQCPDGQHFDKELGKCVPDETVEEEQIQAEPADKEARDLRLKIATLELKVQHKTDEVKEKTDEITKLNEQLQRQKTESNLKIEELTNLKYTQEGAISTLKKHIEKTDNQLSRNTEELQSTITESASKLEKLNTRLTEALKSRDDYKTLSESLQENYSKLTEAQRKLLEENAKLTTELTEAKGAELDWKKEKAELQESYSKVVRFNKGLTEQIKKHGLIVIPPS